MNDLEKDSALKESERKYHQLVEDANSIIMRIDTEGRVTFLNTFAQYFFGFKESEIIGKSVIGTIMPVTDSAGHDLRKMIDEITHDTRKHINNENENILRSGERVWIAWTNRLILNKETNKREVLCVGNNITKIKKAEEVLREMDARKSAFVSRVSHEFKNPLVVIRESLTYLLDNMTVKIVPEQKEMLELAKSNTQRLIRLTTDLLDIAKIESGKIALKLTDINISSLVDEVVTGYSLELARKRIVIKKDIPDIGTARADRDKLIEVVINLLSNAIKYSPSGGKIMIRLSGDAHDVRFEISDNGPGIAREDHEKIFDKFERISAEKEEGTGLGLSICKDLVDLHNGKIWVEGELGKGSTFIVTLPRDPHS